MERVNVLCILGRAGHGKTTAANYLKATYGAQVVSLAAPLKRVAQTVMGFSHEQLYGSQEAKEAIDLRYGMSPRQFLQKLGTDGLRQEFGLDIHVNNLLRQLEAETRALPPYNNKVFVVDDVRFSDEATALSRLGQGHGAVIKIVCTDAPRAGAPRTDAQATEEHSSESSIDLVPEDDIAATVVHSRADGLGPLFAKLEHALSTSLRLARFRYLLRIRVADEPVHSCVREFR
jgi:hypothetical protein